MAIFVDKNTKVLCQGITGTQATFHIRRSLEYGTQVVGGVTPGKGGRLHLGLPVFDTVVEAKKETGATASIMYVPALSTKAAVREAVEAELDLVVCIAEGVPIKDMLEINHMLAGSRTKLIGPNTPGIIVPEEARLGTFPENIVARGNVGIVSRTSALTYEVVIEAVKAGFGQSTVLSLGDDMLIGVDFVETLKRFHEDKKTKAIVLLGRMGGTFEEAGAEYYKSLKNKKPVIASVAGNFVPYGHKMGYAGDVISKGYISTQDKKDIMEDAGMLVVDNISEIGKTLKKIL